MFTDSAALEEISPKSVSIMVKIEAAEANRSETLDSKFDTMIDFDHLK